MALSRELLKRLNSEDDPLPKRLKLAEVAFFTVDLSLVRKEDLLLEWLCKICVTNQHAWKSLNNCLRSAHIDIKAHVKQCLIDTLEQTLNSDTENIYEEVLECCCLLLANNGMRQYFTNKTKNLGLLIKALLNSILKHSGWYNVTEKECNQLVEYELSSKENYVIISIVESLMQIYKQLTITKDELRSIFIHDILYPLCNLVDQRHRDNTNKLGVITYKCIHLLLLGKKKSMPSKQTTESTQAMFSDLFYMLSENAKISSLQSNLLTYKFIFHAVIDIYKSDAIFLDIFFRNLISSSGKYKWEILDASLKLLNDVTLDFDNLIEDVTLSEYLQKFISEILTCDDITCAHYEILIQLSYINPLLIEKNLLDILNKILMKEQIVEYKNLLIAILHASIKLRREQKLISQLLISLKQIIAIKKTYTTSTSSFFPYEFRMKLTKTISNFSSSQIIATLRTLIYYLNTDCVELLQCNTSCKNILMLKATVELLVILFEGMQIFEYSRTLSAHEKFINGLEELGNTLSLLINKALCLSHNKNVIIILLSAVQSLSETQNMLKYYVPKGVVIKKLLFPILDDPWQQLIQRITNFGEDNCKNIMNKLILHRIRLNISDGPIKLHGLIGGLEYAWSTILKFDIDILLFLCDREISKLTYLLLADMTSSENNFCEWINILNKEGIQENRCFVICLLSHIFVQIGQCLSGCTKSVTEHINAKLLMEDEHNDKLLSVLQIIKKQISQEQWVQTANEISFKIELYLKILLHLPLIYLSSNVRTLVFLLVYSISRECEKNDKVSALCNMILLDLLEKTEIDIFQYIEPTILVNQLPQSKAFSKACEFSLCNVTTYAALKSLIKSCAQCKEAMCIILECMEVIKPKVNNEQKIIFKKAEEKLTKAILKTLSEKMNDVLDVKCLIAVLKVTISTGKVTDILKNLTELTLQNIFATKENSNNTSNNILLEQNMQLAIIVLQHRKIFEIQDATIKNLWFIMLEHPCKNLLELLLASTELKEFYEFLRLLYDKTINSLSQADETVWTNVFAIWSDIFKTDMNAKRNKMRLITINNLFEMVLSLDVSDKCWSSLLCLSHDIISAKHLLISDNTVDLIILINLKSLDKVKILSCKNVLAICGTLIKVRTNLITDRLPNLLLLYRNVINIIVHASKNVADKFDEHQFRCLALDIDKLTGLLVKLKKDMVRLSPYVVADFLQLIVEGTVPSYIKMALHNSLCQLIGICDQHGIVFLSRTLPTSLQVVFKVELDTFNKFYKYSGMV